MRKCENAKMQEYTMQESKRWICVAMRAFVWVARGWKGSSEFDDNASSCRLSSAQLSRSASHVDWALGGRSGNRATEGGPSDATARVANFLWCLACLLWRWFPLNWIISVFRRPTKCALGSKIVDHAGQLWYPGRIDGALELVRPVWGYEERGGKMSHGDPWAYPPYQEKSQRSGAN
jgi:hypothetical protein